VALPENGPTHSLQPRIYVLGLKWFGGRSCIGGRSGDHLAAMLGRALGGPISEVTRERTYSFPTA